MLLSHVRCYQDRNAETFIIKRREGKNLPLNASLQGDLGGLSPIDLYRKVVKTPRGILIGRSRQIAGEL